MYTHNSEVVTKNLSRWQKQNIVHGFLNCLPDEQRLEWYHSIEDTYKMLKDGHYGAVGYDGQYYTVAVFDNKNNVYTWSEI